MKYTAQCLHAKCPFFRSESKYSICCEGARSGTELAIKFQTDAAKADYARTHCRQYDSDCEIRAVLQNKY